MFKINIFLLFFAFIFLSGCGSSPTKTTGTFKGKDTKQILVASNDLHKKGDYTTAVEGYKHAATQDPSKQKETAVANNNLAVMYYEGKGVAQNLSKAYELFSKAAATGLANAQYNLGKMYHTGKGVPRNLNQAKSWYKKAAAQGDSQSIYTLGLMAYDKQNFIEAKRLFQQAAAKGNPNAKTHIGKMYFAGKGFGQSYQQAAKWFLKASNENNHAEAQYLLGFMLYKNRKNFKEAKKWFTKAAKQNYAPAEAGLGQLYYKGQGVRRNLGEAVKWTTKAAEQGFPDAQNNLGMMYFKGEGVRKDLVMAYKWVSLASKGGNKQARQGRNFLVKQLSVPQITKGERLAKQWQLQHNAR